MCCMLLSELWEERVCVFNSIHNTHSWDSPRDAVTNCNSKEWDAYIVREIQGAGERCWGGGVNHCGVWSSSWLVSTILRWLTPMLVEDLNLMITSHFFKSFYQFRSESFGIDRKSDSRIWIRNKWLHWFNHQHSL